jgi:glycerol-3-phosphate dehydrogenase (NAD(P)+)
MTIIVLGAGAWGRAIGGLLESQGRSVHYVHHNAAAWPSVKADFAIVALPTQSVRETLKRFPAPGVPVLSLSKGMEIATGRRVSEIIHEVWGETRLASLSGPTLSAEIVKGLPATAVIAAADESLAQKLQETMSHPNFRLYRSTDLIGVEMGGAMKNVYAIAGGICKGMKLGDNSFAGLLTRCVAEMTRIGLSAGGRPETFAGLSGMGDLMLSAMSEQSRNHRVGLMLAAGKKLPEILETVGGVAEGAYTVKSVHQNPAIEADAKPIATQVYEMLYEEKSPRDALYELLGRALKSEMEWAK